MKLASIKYFIFCTLFFIGFTHANPVLELIADSNIQPISESLQKVKDYVPKHIVIAHRGTTYWAPEETEAAFRWARNIGADYLEADLQLTKDGIILALHDDNLNRTTNIAEVYPTRKNDPTNTFTYQELLKLDAGSWFNRAYPDRARKSFEKLEIITLKDLIRIAEGYQIKRNPDGSRFINSDGSFAYIKDSQDSQNRPGIYLELKEPSLNPGIEEKLQAELTELGWNIIKNPASSNEPYLNSKINIGNTNGKVILQTFSKKSLQKIKQLFNGEIPTLLLVELDNGLYDHEAKRMSSFIELIRFAIENKAHFIGPSIGNGSLLYYALLQPWQSDLIHHYKLGIHPYTFDTNRQMRLWYKNIDGMFTNRADLSIKFYKNSNLRNQQTKLQDANAVLDQLGYQK